MLGKLFKHEWKTASKLLLLLHGIVLLFAILTRISLAVSGGLVDTESPLAMMMLMLSMMIIFSAAVFNMIYIGFRFYKSVFTDQGYLTNTLPVTPQQIMIAKGLVGVIWIVLDVIIIIGAFIIVFAEGQFFTYFGEFISEVMATLFNSTYAFFAWLTIIGVIMAPFAAVIEMYVSVAIGNLLSGHKVLGAIGAYVGIYTVQQIVTTLAMAIAGYGAATALNVSSNSVGIQTVALDAISMTMIVALLLSAAFMIAGYFVTKYIMEKKLNLQ